MVYRVMQFT